MKNLDEIKNKERKFKVLWSLHGSYEVMAKDKDIVFNEAMKNKIINDQNSVYIVN